MVEVRAALERLEQLAAKSPVPDLAQAFAQANFELALVGGPVRDCFLGRQVVDLDFTTNATPEAVLEIVKPIASAYWDIGSRFGTIGARIKGQEVEITTYRSDTYTPDSRKPEVVFGDCLEGDLRRRDFTINALAFRVPQRQLVDIAGGLEDLLAGRLVTPIAPEISFQDDPLRMLRAARFSAQLGFEIAPEVLAAMNSCGQRLEVVSAERIKAELEKLLCAANPLPGIRALVATGLADYFLPEVPALQLEVDEHFHHKDVYEHSLIVLKQAIELERRRHPGQEPDLVLRLAALLHDIGKPATRRKESNGSVSFYHHDVVGAKLAAKRLRALRFEKNVINSVSRLVELHLRFFGYSDQAWSDSAVRRYTRDAGDELERLHIITRADVTTRNQRKADRLRRAYDELETRIAQLQEQEKLDALRPELDGEQIMALLNLKPGREVGRAYKFMLELRLDEGLLGQEEATRRLLQWWVSAGGGNTPAR